MSKRERGIHELYAEDPQRADRMLWSRQSTTLTRRDFVRGGGLLTLSSFLGASIPFGHLMPSGLIPAAFAQSDEPFVIKGKEGLIVLNDRPINAETPPHLLNDEITPAKYLFVRNNGTPPSITSIDPKAWRLEVAGESAQRSVTYSISDLKRKFDHHTYRLQLECGGNGRSEFVPSAAGNQWSTGALGCPEWTGVRLADVLRDVGLRDDAVYVAYYGADIHASGDTTKAPISRGVPIAKALEDESLIAWAMNGEDIPHLNGHPLRLVCGGWPGSVSGKWLTKILIRDRVHDGPKMTGNSYRVPCRPVSPGATVPTEDMCIIESMPVKSLITMPRSGIVHPIDEPLDLEGHAWAGDVAVASMHVSIDFGSTWQAAKLEPPANRLAWQRFRARIRFPQLGYYEVWARASDSQGRSQPMVLPGWNPKGYLNNACHRIAVQVASA